MFTQSMLRLYCYVRGDDPDQIFAIDIEEDKTVILLKDAIWKERPSKFSGVDNPSDLLLWKACIRYDDNLRQIVEELELDVGGRLRPITRLSKVFSECEPHVIHIVVGWEKAEHYALKQETHDIMRELITMRERAIEKCRKAKAPSILARPIEYMKHQQELPILDGRYSTEVPLNTLAPPIELFHPAFRHFYDDLSNKDLSIPTYIIQETASFMRTMSVIYENEAARKSAVKTHLQKLLNVEVDEVINEDKTRAGTVHELPVKYLNEKGASLFWVEKNEVGSGGCDPSIQVGLSYFRYWVQQKHTIVRSNSSCPAFLLATVGPLFTVLGGVITSGCIVQRLTDLVWTGTLNDGKCLEVAYIMYALRRSIKKLDDYYHDLKLDTACFDVHHHPYIFPSICAYPGEGGQIIPFKYVVPLEADPCCVTYRAQTITDDAKQIVVKFVEQYGEKAHRLLAAENLAPKLLYYGKIDFQPGEPADRILQMVVMEYVDGETLDEANKSGRVPQTIKQKIRRALDILHNGGFVFGDLRPSNVMITDAGEPKLIDFDWAGVQHESRYPPFISSAILWPPGVQGNAIMEKTHDDLMFEKLFE